MGPVVWAPVYDVSKNTPKVPEVKKTVVDSYDKVVTKIDNVKQSVSDTKQDIALVFWLIVGLLFLKIIE